jgi:hypothetical protein
VGKKDKRIKGNTMKKGRHAEVLVEIIVNEKDDSCCKSWEFGKEGEVCPHLKDKGLFFTEYKCTLFSTDLKSKKGNNPQDPTETNPLRCNKCIKKEKE